jgi:hypothetical protein
MKGSEPLNNARKLLQDEDRTKSLSSLYGMNNASNPIAVPVGGKP